MADVPRDPISDNAVRFIDRRHALQWLAFAIAGFNQRQLFAQNQAPTGARRPGSATILDAVALRKAIRMAPEENPGKPGLYSLNLSDDDRYPVIGIRRTLSTRSEVHADFNDVWYVLEGSATLVTGGVIVGGIETSSGEMRGRGITGGESRQIRAGDFAVIPAGVPHWVSRVRTAQLIYFVVKVRTSN